MKKIILTAAAVFVLSGCTGSPASSTYPTAAICTAINGDCVTVETATGIVYSYYGADDNFTGDLIALTMDDNGTPETVLDDKVVDARYCGFWQDGDCITTARFKI